VGKEKPGLTNAISVNLIFRTFFLPSWKIKRTRHIGLPRTRRPKARKSRRVSMKK
jgi:hypothetical protein